MALSAWASGEMASRYALRPEPFYDGGVVAVLALGLSALFVRETRGHVALEITQTTSRLRPTGPAVSFRRVFAVTTWRDRKLAAACQARLIKHLNDGMSWGSVRSSSGATGLGVAAIGVIKAAYPGVWGALQIVQRAVQRLDRPQRPHCRREVRPGRRDLGHGPRADPIRRGCWAPWGLGTGMVYPTLLAVIEDVAHPAL